MTERDEMTEALIAATKRTQEQRSEIGDLTHKLVMAMAELRDAREHNRELLDACKCALDLGVDTYAAGVIRAAIARATGGSPNNSPVK